MKILLSFRSHPAKVRLYIIVDAMDESDDGDRRGIIRLLHRLCATTELCVVKVFLASRPIAGLKRHSAENYDIIKLQDENRPDILKFAELFLGPELELPPDTVRQAKEYRVQNAQGVFVWVHLVRDELLRYVDSGCTKNQLFGFLRSLPTELEQFYQRILTKLENGEGKDIKDGLRMLQLVSFAYRPLRLEELRQALAIPDSLDAVFSYFDESFEGDLIIGIDKRVISCAGNFLEIKGVHGTSFYR
jgi:hypothetical protein